MPDATSSEWIVEYFDTDAGTQFDHVATREDAIKYLCQLVGQGKTATLYQRVPFEVQIGVTVKSPRRRRKKEAKEDAGAAVSRAETTPPVQGSASPVPEAVRTASDLASPVFPWTCEARFDGDPVCPGHVERDPTTGGWFCDLHLTAIAPSCRREMHRRHASRNRPVRVAHAG